MLPLPRKEMCLLLDCNHTNLNKIVTLNCQIKRKAVNDVFPPAAALVEDSLRQLPVGSDLPDIEHVRTANRAREKLRPKTLMIYNLR